MTEFSEYWLAKHKHLLNDYRDENGHYSQACGEIANEVVRKLREDGRKPSIWIVTGISIGDARTKELVPLVYEGRIRWGGHIVCVDEDLVYDPILEKPEPMDSYGITAFGQEIMSEEASWLLEVK